MSVSSKTALEHGKDHRALDGAQAGMFMRSVKDHLESIRADEQVY